MAFRPEWFPRSPKGGAEEVLTLALYVKGYYQGSYETSTADNDLNVKALKWVLENWNEYSPGDALGKRFDIKVQELIRIAIAIDAQAKCIGELSEGSHTPTELTREAIEQLESGKGHSCDSVEEFLKQTKIWTKKEES